MADEQRYHDFDAFFDEQVEKPKPLVVKVLGQEYTLPASLPAGVALMVVRARSQKRKELTDNEMFKMAEMLFTRPVLDDWSVNGLTVPQLEHMVEYVMGEYMNGMKEAEAETEEDDATTDGGTRPKGKRRKG